MDEVQAVLLCGLCQKAPATGSWSICPDCRRQLADRQSQRFASMAPGSCVACQQSLPGRRVAGVVYCPRCTRRFGGNSRALVAAH